MTIKDTQPPQTSSQTGVEIGDSGGITGSLQEVVKSLTEQLTKMQTEYRSMQESLTQDIRKSLDVGGDESEKRGVADASNEWSSIARHRASQLQKSANALDYLQQMSFNNAQFALGIGQLSLVREYDQQGSHNWDTRCGSPKNCPNYDKKD